MKVKFSESSRSEFLHLDVGCVAAHVHVCPPLKQNLPEIILISCDNDLHLCREYFLKNIGKDAVKERSNS